MMRVCLQRTFDAARRLPRVLCSPRLWAASGLVLLGSSVSSLPSETHASDPNGLLRFPLERAVLTAPVDSGPLTLDVSLRGRLEAVDNTFVTSECYRTVRLIEILPEGTWVKKGQVIARLDASDIEDRVRRERVDVIESKAAVDAAAEAIELQKLKNEKTLAAAKLALELTELDYQTYREAKFPQELRTGQNELSLAEEAMVRQQKNVEFVSQMVRKGYQQAIELEEAQADLRQAEHKYRVAAGALKLLKQHEKRRELTALAAKARNSRDELDRVMFANRSSITSREIALTAAQKRHQRNSEYLAKLETALAACTIRAPRSGRLVHAKESTSRSAESIAEGSYVRDRQTIAEIPRFDRMKVAIRIHESQVRHIEEGLRVTVSTEATGTRTFTGTVTEVSSVPVSGDWPNYDLKQYPATVVLDEGADPGAELRPGLTAEAVVHVDARGTCAQVPVQAIVPIDREDKQTDMTVLVRSGDSVEVRTIKTGLTTAAMIEVTDGLQPGEEVVLSPRTEFSDELTQLYRAG